MKLGKSMLLYVWDSVSYEVLLLYSFIVQYLHLIVITLSSFYKTTCSLFGSRCFMMAGFTKVLYLL